MNISKKYQDCETCEYNNNNWCLSPKHCPYGYGEWIRGEFDQVIKNTPCALCVHCNGIICAKADSCTNKSNYILDNNKLYELFFDHIILNKPTVKGLF